MYYYKKDDNSMIATVGVLDLPKVTKEEFESHLQESEKHMEEYAGYYERIRPRTIEEGMIELQKRFWNNS